MKFKKLQEKGHIAEFEVTDASPAFINSLRRAVIGLVPVLAIELVEFRKNSGIMYDEMVAHRLGLVPLTTPVGEYALPTREEMDEQEFTARSSVKGTLSVKGPCTVYAKDLNFKDPKVKPVFPETPITQLLEGQEIELEVTAVLGRGKEHAKWSAGLAYYHEIASVKGKSLPVGDERSQVAAGAYDNVDLESKDYERGSNHYYLRIESWGQIPPTELLKLGAEELTSLLKEFDGLLKA